MKAVCLYLPAHGANGVIHGQMFIQSFLFVRSIIAFVTNIGFVALVVIIPKMMTLVLSKKHLGYGHNRLNYKVLQRVQDCFIVF